MTNEKRSRGEDGREQPSRDNRIAGALDAKIGSRLKAIRLLRDMTQTQLGDGAGMRFQQVQKYEQGHSRMAVSTLYKFAKVLSVEPAMLLPPTSRKDDALNGLADVLGERGVVALLKQVALVPEERRGELVRAFTKLVG